MLNTPAKVLLSGGIDSAACAKYLLNEGFDVSAVFIDYGQAGAAQERSAANAVTAALHVPLSTVMIQGPETFGSGEILGRNAFLVLATVTLCKFRSGVIAIGIHSGTPYYDCGPAFLASIDRLVAEHTDGLTRVIAPFISWTKPEIFDYYVHAGLSPQITYSCEAGQTPPCGMCASCKDRRMLGCFT